MATTAEASGSSSSGLLSASKEKFAQLVSSYTGLDRNVVRAWVLAENAPESNPLGIMASPGHLMSYASPDVAAQAVAKNLLTNPLYARVRLTVQKPGSASGRGTSPTAQLTAIANSPWDSNHYRGAGVTSGPLGRLLFGTYTHVQAA